jgi:hypothetical protein
MQNCSSPLIPVLSPIAMTDWLPKLGDKAFLAWLQFHSWKEDSLSPDEPFLLSLPLKQIMKKLQVGSTTFYDKILRPLWNYALIDLQPSHGKQRGIHLLVYSFPQNDPPKAAEPLTQIRLYDETRTPPIQHTFCTASKVPSSDRHPALSPNKTAVPEENVPLPGTIPFPNEDTVPYEDTSPPSDRSSFLIQENSMKIFKEIDIKDRLKDDPSDPILYLPSALRKEIEQDPQLQVRSDHIARVYLQCKDHPRYTDTFFLEKVHLCTQYSHDLSHFAAYLHKAILNEWKKPFKPPQAPSPAPVRAPAVPRHQDLPPWIRAQLFASEAEPSLSPEQQASANHLLRALGEM